MSEVKIITAAQVEAKIEAGEELEVIDVREVEEVVAGMIPDARHIPMNEIPLNLEQLDKEKEYIIVCRSGMRSESVCYYMQDHGFKAINMIDGMLHWQGELFFK